MVTTRATAAAGAGIGATATTVVATTTSTPMTNRGRGGVSHHQASNNRNTKTKNKNQPTFRPFVNATTETPLLHMILEPTCLSSSSWCSSSTAKLITHIYRCRWFLSTPLRVNLVPKWIMNLPPMHIGGGGGAGGNCGVTVRPPVVTIGEVVVLVPLLLLILEGYYYSWVVPDTYGSGYYASYLIFITFATANKSNSVFSLLLGIPFERMIGWHHTTSLLSLLVTIFHIYTAYRFTDDSVFANVNLLSFLLDGKVNVTGTVATAGLVLLIVTSSFRVVRRYLYQAWLIVHIMSAIAVLVGLILHHVPLAMFVALWWALDWIVRYLVQASCTHRTTATLRLIDQKPSGEYITNTYEPSVELLIDNTDRTIRYTAGQYVRIAVPAINVLEFHPVSISSAPHEDQLTFHVRNLGDWTAKLVQLASTTTTSTMTTTVLLEGPYGAPSINYDDDQHYQHFLFIGGGIGITPLQSIGKTILYQHATQGRTVHSFRYIWAVRDLHIVDDIPPLGLVAGQSRSSSTDLAQVDIYCTRTPSEEEETDLDELSRRPYNVHMGRRPDLNAVFAETKAQIMASSSKRRGGGRREASVAVIACGPTQLMHDVERLCHLYSPSVVGCNGGGDANDAVVYFDLHQEHFEF